jgi:predicted nuclease of predicted toxin-antitoxin system
MTGSALKFLIDAGVGRQVERWLRENGYDVLAVRDLDPRMLDAAILKLAAEEKRLVITMDKDFGELVYRSQTGHAGVLLLRLGHAAGEQKVQVVCQIMDSYAEKLAGNFCVYQEGRLRIR